VAYVRILLLADSGFDFAREALMSWCEENRVDYVFGLARNTRLVGERIQAEDEAGRPGEAARRFKDFRYATLDSWSCRRPVVGKAEWTRREANPQFVVISLAKSGAGARPLREDLLRPRRHGKPHQGMQRQPLR